MLLVSQTKIALRETSRWSPYIFETKDNYYAFPALYIWIPQLFSKKAQNMVIHQKWRSMAQASYFWCQFSHKNIRQKWSAGDDNDVWLLMSLHNMCDSLKNTDHSVNTSWMPPNFFQLQKQHLGEGSIEHFCNTKNEIIECSIKLCSVIGTTAEHDGNFNEPANEHEKSVQELTEFAITASQNAYASFNKGVLTNYLFYIHPFVKHLVIKKIILCFRKTSAVN